MKSKNNENENTSNNNDFNETPSKDTPNNSNNGEKSGFEKKEKDFNKFKIGGRDNNNQTIEQIFYLKKAHYIIYSTKEHRWVRVEIATEYTYYPKHIVFAKDIGILRELLRNRIHRRLFISRIAAVIYCCYEDKNEVAAEIMNSLKISVKRYKKLIGRLEYLAGAIVLGSLSLIIIGMMLKASILTGILPEFDVVNLDKYKLILKVMSFGVLGSILSVSINLNNIDIDIESGNTIINVIVGGTRTLIGIISGLIAYYLIESGLVLSSITSNEHKESIIFVLATLSGFSEKYIPGMLDKISSNTNSPEKGHKPEQKTEKE